MPTTMRFRRDGVALHLHPVAGSANPEGRWHGPWERHPSEPNAHSHHDAEHPFILVGRYPVAWERRELYLSMGRLNQNQIDTYFRSLNGEVLANTFGRNLRLQGRRGLGSVSAAPGPLSWGNTDATAAPEVTPVAALLAYDQRRFGVEIECIMDQTAFIEKVRAKGISIRYQNYNHANSLTEWKLVSDGSLRYSGDRVGFHAIELVSPILQGTNGINQLQLVCEALAETRALVNRTCGLHVHHDASTAMDMAGAKRLAHNYHNAQKAIDKLLSASRRSSNNGAFCHPFTRDDLDTIDRSVSLRSINVLTRYKALNLTAYSRHQTFEFRQHQGSVEFQKIRAWVIFGQCMMAAAQRGVEVPSTSDLNQLFAAIDLPEEVREYFHSRAAALATETVS